MTNGRQTVIPSPVTLTQNSSGVTHSRANTTTTDAMTIAKFQVPAGVAYVFGGARDGQKFYYHDPDNVDDNLSGVFSIYKVSPDEDFLAVLIGQYHSDRTSASASDKTKLPEVGLEAARTIKEDEWLYIKFAQDSAPSGVDYGYIPSESAFALDLTKLTSVSL